MGFRRLDRLVGRDFALTLAGLPFGARAFLAVLDTLWTEGAERRAFPGTPRLLFLKGARGYSCIFSCWWYVALLKP